ncbi:hypothetical protein ACFW2V_13625 [Streptomyces sp. NPDC058947]|uniref:hypothetical protein n=1 Tax=Streptomyces sp. NPDC058947 TaxID=3346675 RepID=UPI0036AFE49F
MIDWWTVPGRTWGVTNLDFKVELRPDDEIATKDLEPYSAADEIALDKGYWRFVIVTVIPMDEDLVDHIGATCSLDGVEWGEMPGGRIDRNDLLDHPIKGLVIEAVLKLLRNGFTVEIEEGSAFSLELLSTAPF